MVRVRAAVRAWPGGHLLARLLFPARRSAIVLRVALVVSAIIWAIPV